MIATIQLDANLDERLDRVSKMLDKKREEVIREALIYYSKKVENDKSSRLVLAAKKTMNADREEYEHFEGTIDDGL